ncbi:MAG: hypothetical protein JW963_22415 [Anaerolineales bacterium]|nr:hypothetical protein [Anaerolineales bacterium]
MELNLGQWVVIVVCAILILGYIRGYYYNRQRAGQIFAWLKEGLETLGPVSAGDKLPGMASGGQLEVKRAAAPIKRVEAVYLLAPRENLLFWLFHLLQGKRDELILWVTYQSKSEQEVEVARPGDRQFESRLKASDKKPLTVSDGPRGLRVASEQKKGGTLTDKVQLFLEQYGSVVYRLALRDNKPHLFLRVNLRVMQSASAVEFFSTLRELAN